MKKIITISCVVLLAVQFMACSKKSSSTNTNPNQNQPLTTKPTLNAMEKLLVGNWMMKSATEYYSDYNGTKSTTNIFDKCETDDVYVFTDSLTYSVSDGNMSCASNGGYNMPNSWSIGDNDSILSNFYFLKPLLTIEAPTITQLNQTILTLKITNYNYGASWQKYDFIYSFQRK